MAVKEMTEMNKVELYKEIRWNNRMLRKIAEGRGSEVETMDYATYFAYYESNQRFMAELLQRGMSKQDYRVRDAHHNASYRARRFLEAKLGY